MLGRWGQIRAYLLSPNLGSVEAVKAALDSAERSGQKIILDQANIGRGIWVKEDQNDSTWWPYAITQMSAGRTRLDESETDLRRTGDIGSSVYDYRASGDSAWAVGRDAGWFQQRTIYTWDYGARMPYTASFWLRADTGECAASTPVCTLAVSLVLGGRWSVVRLASVGGLDSGSAPVCVCLRLESKSGILTVSGSDCA